MSDRWIELRARTPARLALGRVGVSLPTGAQLDFQRAHARARDAVHDELATGVILADLAARRLAAFAAQSAAPDRATYLRRPDLGRALAPASEAAVAAAGGIFDLAFVIADGLSAAAVNRQAVALIAATLAALDDPALRLAPTAVVAQGRVAIGDAVAGQLGATLVAVLIGERPGLSAPQSMGVYVTWAPRVGTVDAARNCISNIHAHGLSIADAAATLATLLQSARRHRCTGVALGQRQLAEAARPA